MKETAKANIVLVGVSGVGKTTLGQVSSEYLGMQFVDIDTSFEQEEDSNIDTLLETYGQDGYDQRLLAHYLKIVKSSQDVILAAPPQLVGKPEFWQATRVNAISIHLRGKPLEVYMRQDVWIGVLKLSQEEKLSKENKRDFYWYYDWRLKHCQKADLTLRVQGNINKDVADLVELIQQIKSKNPM